MKKIGKDEYAAAFGCLSAHETDSLNMLGFLEYNETPDIWIGGNPVDCVVIRKKDTDMFFINAYSDESILSAAKEIFSLSEKVFFSGVRKEIADKLLALADKTDEDLLHDDCLLYLYPEKTIDVSDIPENVRPVDISCAETLDYFYTYRSQGSLEKIKKEISSRPSAATYIDGEIACWSLIHEDGSMGAMFTKPQYRHGNLAVNTSKYLISQQLARGKTPFVHIVDINTPSIKLAEKIGLKYAYPVVWFEASFKNISEKTQP